MIFVDTSFWVAVQLPRDAHHDAATALLRTHVDVRRKIRDAGGARLDQR